MREAIGTSFIFNLVMIFTGVLIVLYVGSIAYTKGFKIRNRMIDIIEKHDGFADGSLAQEEIALDLADIGYKVVPDGEETNCSDRPKQVSVFAGNGYNYCVYKYEDKYGDYYGVTAFITFDVPLVGASIEIPIYGETRTLFDEGSITG